MNRRTLDIRASTCKGGGALWAFLSHVCELQPGGVLELITDDPQARVDLPEWAACEGWGLLEERVDGQDQTYVLQRPWQKQHVVRPALAAATAAPA